MGANTYFGIQGLDVMLVLGTLIFFGLLEVISGMLRSTKRGFGDWIQELGGFLALSVAIKPLVVLAAIAVMGTILPNTSQVVAGWSLWLAVPVYILIDDVLQYWYHRSAHEYEFLWKLHRPHHQAEEMGFFISYRNAGLYYVIMPNLWWIGVFTFFGGGIAVGISLVLKQLIIIGSHSTISWDKPLYKVKWFSPIMSVIERIIITPAFHHAHHGVSKADNISDPNGNFGNAFSIWDQMFGSAMFTRKFPEKYGLQTATDDSWYSAYFYPLVGSQVEGSEIARGFTKEKTAFNDSITMELEAGTYLWCQCGKSKNQPFCDGMHHGSKIKPLKFEVKKKREVKLCNCKQTKRGPFCDNSHLKL